MSIRLTQSNYGKSRVRLLRVSRTPARHDVTELTLAIHMEGDFESAHTDGDNSKVLPTDTMKNTVYALARAQAPDSPEEFALRIADHFLTNYPQASLVGVDASETLWARMNIEGKEHPSAFVRAGAEERTVTLTATRDSKAMRAGIDNLIVLKNAQSGFEKFLKDRYTTLKETSDRIFSTAIRASWLYKPGQVDFDSVWSRVREKLLTAFARHDSLSVQHTLYAMGEAVLKDFAEICEIRLSLPNKHYNLVDLAPFEMDNPNVVFVPTDEPFGLIEATLTSE